jgi:hypothetical protein
VGSRQELILIDTNIFVIDLRYKRSTNFHLFQPKPIGSRIRAHGSKVTTDEFLAGHA